MSTLYVLGTSITDNIKDISQNTINIISKCNVAIGEERKIALKLLNIANSNADLFLINEHSTDEDRDKISDILLDKEVSVFFSDAGTPCISDPDYKFIKLCRDKGIIVKSVPGPSSITAALSISGINASKFIFNGFPPREKELRKKYFSQLENMEYTTVFMERPYALEATIKDLEFIKSKISICLNLGKENEESYFDTPNKLLNIIKNKKAPFIVIIPPVEKNIKKNKENYIKNNSKNNNKSYKKHK